MTSAAESGERAFEEWRAELKLAEYGWQTADQSCARQEHDLTAFA
jgi:hypothetical protein